MESVARQFLADGDKAVIVRNGWFSYRWTQIIEKGKLTGDDNVTVLKARRVGDKSLCKRDTTPATPGQCTASWQPAPAADVAAAIAAAKPTVVFAPHVETSAGMVLPDAYIKEVAAAAKAAGALFVLDCIASGTAWIDM
jgi:aspartate aminotransferase-like enzyme